MKRLLFLGLPLGLAILAAAWALSAFRASGEATEARLERARLKRDFVERAALGRTLPPDRLPEWRDESAALTRWYFDGLSAIRNRFPTEPARPTGLAAAGGDKKLADKDRAMLEEWQKLADDRFELLKSGRYVPVASAAAEGLRLDLLAVEPGASPEGGAPGLRIDFALWGAPRYLERERANEKTTVRGVSPVSFQTIAFRFLDSTGKLYGEMNGPGEPYQKLADGERWVDDFPPGILFGTWWVELFPRETATVELEVLVEVRGASGLERPAPMKWSLPVPEGWKLPPGAAYQAEIREAVDAPPSP
jgi:hypothetical protein